MPNIISKEDLFGKKKRTQEVVIPAFGPENKLLIQELGFGERNEIHEKSSREIVPEGVSRLEQIKNRRTEVDTTKFGAFTVMAGVVNSDGSKYFSPDDYNKVISLPPVLIDALSSAIWELSGVDWIIEKNEAGA